MARRRSLVPVVVALALLLAGCSTTNTMTTRNPYEPSDGVRAELDQVTVGNLLILAAAEGAPGTVIGYVSNTGTDAVRVTIGVADASEGRPVRVRAGETVLLGPDGDDTVDVESVPVPPGGVVDVTVSSGQGGTTTVPVPVLDATLPEYADLVPTTD